MTNRKPLLILATAVWMLHGAPRAMAYDDKAKGCDLDKILADVPPTGNLAVPAAGQLRAGDKYCTKQVWDYLEKASGKLDVFKAAKRGDKEDFTKQGATLDKAASQIEFLGIIVNELKGVNDQVDVVLGKEQALKDAYAIVLDSSLTPDARKKKIPDIVSEAKYEYYDDGSAKSKPGTAVKAFYKELIKLAKMDLVKRAIRDAAKKGEIEKASDDSGHLDGVMTALWNKGDKDCGKTNKERAAFCDIDSVAGGKLSKLYYYSWELRDSVNEIILTKGQFKKHDKKHVGAVFLDAKATGDVKKAHEPNKHDGTVDALETKFKTDYDSEPAKAARAAKEKEFKDKVTSKVSKILLGEEDAAAAFDGTGFNPAAKLDGDKKTKWQEGAREDANAAYKGEYHDGKKIDVDKIAATVPVVPGESEDARAQKVAAAVANAIMKGEHFQGKLAAFKSAVTGDDKEKGKPGDPPAYSALGIGAGGDASAVDKAPDKSITSCTSKSEDFLHDQLSGPMGRKAENSALRTKITAGYRICVDPKAKGDDIDETLTKLREAKKWADNNDTDPGETGGAKQLSRDKKCKEAWEQEYTNRGLCKKVEGQEKLECLTREEEQKKLDDTTTGAYDSVAADAHQKIKEKADELKADYATNDPTDPKNTSDRNKKITPILDQQWLVKKRTVSGHKENASYLDWYFDEHWQSDDKKYPASADREACMYVHGIPILVGAARATLPHDKSVRGISKDSLDSDCLVDNNGVGNIKVPAKFFSNEEGKKSNVRCWEAPKGSPKKFICEETSARPIKPLKLYIKEIKEAGLKDQGKPEKRKEDPLIGEMGPE